MKKQPHAVKLCDLTSIKSDLSYNILCENTQLFVYRPFEYLTKK